MRYVLLIICAICFTMSSITGCSTVVPAGEEAVKVNQWGKNRGVDQYPIKTGRVFYNPISEDVFKFPIHKINETWNDRNDMAVSFNSYEGAAITADIFISYAFKPELVPQLYVEFRTSAENITKSFLYAEVRNSFSRHGSLMKISDIYGPMKGPLEDSVLVSLQRKLEPKGFLIYDVAIVGKPKIDSDFETAIHNTVIAAQQAISAQNKIVQYQAEAKQKVATARGDSLSAVINARGQAAANLELSRSLTPEIVQWNMIQKWNGVLPQATGGATPFLSLKP